MTLRKVWVSGGSGYVGSKLVERLVGSKQWDVTVFESQIFGNPVAGLADTGRVKFVQGDITDRPAVEASMAGNEYVVHLAGIVTDELVDMNTGYGERVNVGGTFNVARSAQKLGVKRLLYASSSSVYGEAAEGAIPPNEDVEPLPKTEYARQKLNGENVVNAVGHRVEVVSVRQATACGPAPRMRLDTVVNIFSKQAYFDGVITPYGGEQYRSNVHVADAARFYEHLLNWFLPFKRNVYNLTNHNRKVIDIAKEVQAAAVIWGKSPEIAVKDVEDSRSYRMDGKRVETELSFFPELGIKQAALNNFEWFERTGLDPNDPIYRNNARMGDLVKGK